MSLAAITLTSVGVSATLEAWGIEAATLITTDAGEDQLLCQIAPETIDGAEVFPADQKVELFDVASGNRVFTGYRASAPRRGSGAEMMDTFTIAGPQCLLAEITYQTQANFAADPEVFDLDSITPLLISEFIANRAALTGAKIDVKTQIQRYLDYAISQGAFIAYNLTAIPADIMPPESQETDLSCWQGIRGQLRWWPAGGMRWEHATSPPTLIFVAIAAGDITTPTGTTVRSVAVTDAEDLTIDARDELKVTSFEICYLSENSSEEAGTGRTIKWRTRHLDVSTASNGSRRKEMITVRLRGKVWDGEQWTDGEPVPADGLAAELHRPYKVAQYQATWSRTTDDFLWSHQPCEIWNFSGGRVAWTIANTPCRAITRDLATGRVSYESGPRDRIGLNDLLALRMGNKLRNRPSQASAGGETYGFEQDDEPDVPESEELEIEFCKDGALVTRTVLAKPIPPP